MTVSQLSFYKDRVARLLDKVLIAILVAAWLVLGLFNDFALIAPDSAVFRSPSLFFFSLVPVVFLCYFFFSSVKIDSSYFRIEHFLLFAILCWVLISFVGNYLEIVQLSARTTSGIEVAFKAVRFFLMATIACVAASNLLGGREDVLIIFEKAIIASFVLILPYTFVEIAWYFLDWDGAKNILTLLDSIFHARRGEEYSEIFRIRGLAFEPSFLGMYLAVVFPWLFVSAIRKHSVSALLAVLALIFAILSRSRTAYVSIVVELCIVVFFVGLQGRKSLVSWWRVVRYGLLAVAILIISVFALEAVLDDELLDEAGVFVGLTFSSIFDESIASNLTRVGSQHAALLVALDNPVLGVGPGMSGAHVHHYYPGYMYQSYEIANWITAAHQDFSAPAFGLFAGIAAELGFVGLAFFLVLWCYSIWKVYSKFGKNYRRSGCRDYQGIALGASMLGVLISSFGLNGYIFVGYWLLLISAFIYTKSE